MGMGGEGFPEGTAATSTRKKTAGQILSELARKALCPPRTYDVRNGVPIIHRAPGAPLITSADVKRLQEDEDER